MAVPPASRFAKSSRSIILATVARERRYSLTLLAEAHRGDESLDALLARFDTESAGLPVEARRMWIDLLRETGATFAELLEAAYENHRESASWLLAMPGLYMPELTELPRYRRLVRLMGLDEPS